MGNNDLERNERAVSSSLADMESKYSRVLEEKILLEHELLEKAGLEEEDQRLKDELRGICLSMPMELYSDLTIILLHSRCQRRNLYTEGSASPCTLLPNLQVKARVTQPFNREPPQNGSSSEDDNEHHPFNLSAFDAFACICL